MRKEILKEKGWQKDDRATLKWPSTGVLAREVFLNFMIRLGVELRYNECGEMISNRTFPL